MDRVKQGKKNRASGAAFELRVRKELESEGWIVDKWSNNIESYIPDKNFVSIEDDLSYKRLCPAKRKYAGPGRPMAIGTGFPDFLVFRENFGVTISQDGFYINSYEVIGVEVKTNGKLDKTEKEKCKWLLDNNIFSKILIAKKTKVKNQIVIVYEDFKEKYGK